MKRYLIYNNIVRGAGIGHTMGCYNYAVQISLNTGLKLIIPKIRLGHKLGDDFRFEKFWGLDTYDDSFIKSIANDENENIEYSSDNSPHSYNFSETKSFFYDRYLATEQSKFKYPSHHVPDKINIAIPILLT